MIDTHCHLDDPSFEPDREAVVSRARSAGVTAIVIPAVRPRTFDRVRALAARYPEVRVALGVHPQIVPDLDDDERSAVPRWLARELSESGAVAVGECGLDGGTGEQDEQERLFLAQIAVARELRLPLLVHVLRAHDRAPRLLEEAGADAVGGILHSYSGGADLVARYRDLGFAFSFAGPITYENARRPVEAARAIPGELLCAETDAPDQAPSPHRGTRSEPAYLREIQRGLARARGVDEESLDRLVTGNARRVLRLEAGA
jgi:TatD DNase family protein